MSARSIFDYLLANFKRKLFCIWTTYFSIPYDKDVFNFWNWFWSRLIQHMSYYDDMQRRNQENNPVDSSQVVIQCRNLIPALYVWAAWAQNRDRTTDCHPVSMAWMHE